MSAVAALREAGPVETVTTSVISSVLHRLGDPISRRLAFVLDRGVVILHLLAPGEERSAVSHYNPSTGRGRPLSN